MHTAHLVLPWPKRLETYFPRRKREKYSVGVVFAIVFVLVSYWYLIPLVIGNLASFSQVSQRQADPHILSVLHTKGGISLDSYTVSNSPKLYGAMGGLPGFPQLILSAQLLEDFSSAELEYVLLHEAGHAVRGHMLRELLLVLASTSIVSSLFLKAKVWHKHKNTQVQIAVAAAIVGALLMIQIQRMHEYEADMYALMRGAQPQAMITATKKFQEAAGGESDASLLRWAFYRGIPYGKRIDLAKQYMFTPDFIR